MRLDNVLKEGWHHYHATVEWWCNREIKGAASQLKMSQRKPVTVVVHASSADSALRQVHATMQKSKELNLDRQVARPVLFPDEYLIKKLCIPYKDAKGLEHEHAFDLPVGVNPDLRPDKTPAPQPDAMPFLDEVKGQGQLSS